MFHTAVAPWRSAPYSHALMPYFEQCIRPTHTHTRTHTRAHTHTPHKISFSSNHQGGKTRSDENVLLHVLFLGGGSTHTCLTDFNAAGSRLSLSAVSNTLLCVLIHMSVLMHLYLCADSRITVSADSREKTIFECGIQSSLVHEALSY